MKQLIDKVSALLNYPEMIVDTADQATKLACLFEQQQ